MAKKNKILIILAVCSGLIILALSVTSSIINTGRERAKDVTVNQSTTVSQNKVEAVDLAMLESSYKEKTRALYLDSQSLFKQNDLSMDGVEKVKDALLGLTVPKEFKNLHFNMVFAMIKLENYISNGQQEDFQDGSELIDSMENEYAWLASNK